MDFQPTTISAPDTKEMESSGTILLESANQLVIQTDDDLIIGDQLLGAIKSKVMTFKPGLDQKCEEAHGIHKFLTTLRSRVLAPFTSAETITKQKMAAYDFQKQEVARKEAERLAAIAQRKAEEERRREIEEAKKAKDKERVQELKAAPIIPEIQAPPIVASPKLSNTTFRDAGYDFRITEELAIPRKYLTPDLDKIKSVVKALGKECDIPGIVVFQKHPTVASR